MVWKIAAAPLFCQVPMFSRRLFLRKKFSSKNYTAKATSRFSLSLVLFAPNHLLVRKLSHLKDDFFPGTFDIRPSFAFSLVPSSTRSTTVHTPFAICLPRSNCPELHSAHSSLLLSSMSHSSTRGRSGRGAWKINRTPPPDARVNPFFSESSNRQLILHRSPTKHGFRFRYGTIWERGPAGRFTKAVARRFKTVSDQRQAVALCKKELSLQFDDTARLPSRSRTAVRRTVEPSF